MDLWVVFLTGLTTGGLTCLAVQGGLLATALTRQLPAAPQHTRKKPKAASKAAQTTLVSVQLPKNPWPVAYFLLAKLLAYTALGFLLGALGSVVQLTPTAQAIMQIVAGLFMLATALNILNVHPIFRYAVIQPPKALMRLVRNQSRSQEAFAPALLGLMTVFIPCGTTQAMEVLAISSANPILGALIMFAFTLGASPSFFVLGFLATQIRGKLQPIFVVATAFLIMFLGIISLDGALNLLDVPIAPSRVLASIFQSGPSGTPAAAEAVNGMQQLTIRALDNRYAPNLLSARSGQPIRLRLLSDNLYACTRLFTIPSLKIRRMLPDTGEVVIDLPPQQPGRLFFTCSMGMYSGIINIT